MTNQEQNELPKINWVKNDPELNYFQDGSEFLVALFVINNKTKDEGWEFDRIVVRADSEDFGLEYPDGTPYDAWQWEDFEYYHLIKGAKPIRD